MSGLMPADPGPTFGGRGGNGRVRGAADAPMIKRLLKKSYAANVGWYVWRHLRLVKHYRRHSRPASGGAYSSGSPEDAARRALRWGNEFRRRLPADRPLEFVVEVGVGDSLAMALLWIGFGAQRVWGLEAFGDPRQLPREKAVFQSLLSLVPEDEGCRIREVVDLTGESLVVDPDRLRYMPHAPTEEILRAIPAGSVDLMYSLAVLEHVRDLEASLREMYQSLRPGGRMLHQVDLRNHGVLAEFGEQAFLRPSPWVWSLMGGTHGLHNRKPLDSYVRALEECGAEVTIESEFEFEVERSSSGVGGGTISDVRVFWLGASRRADASAGQPSPQPLWATRA